MLKTKIPLLKKKKYGELAGSMFMSTFRKHGNMQRKLTRKIITCDQTIVLHLISFIYFTSYPGFQFCTCLPISTPKRLKSKLLL